MFHREETFAVDRCRATVSRPVRQRFALQSSPYCYRSILHTTMGVFVHSTWQMQKKNAFSAHKTAFFSAHHNHRCAKSGIFAEISSFF
jgi:hypothetical protein